jgi:dTDP-4-dehydrorhamnose reductase
MHGKKIVVTGSKGMLGSNLLTYLSLDNCIGLEVDITDISKVYNKLVEEKPDIIIHTAAYTNVEECETNRDKTYRVNTIGTQNLVNYCIDRDILLVYISSTGIYGTSKENNYTEFDDVNPTTIHHKSKYKGEIVIQNHLSKYLILRTGWLYGGEKEHAKNFVYKRFLEAQGKDVIYSDNTQIGNPTYVQEFVNQIKILIEEQQYGVFNMVNGAVNISRFDYVSKIIDLFDVDCQVKVAPRGMFNRIAPVSFNESAQNYKLELLGLNSMKHWEEALECYIEGLKDD